MPDSPAPRRPAPPRPPPPPPAPGDDRGPGPADAPRGVLAARRTNLFVLLSLGSLLLAQLPLPWGVAGTVVGVLAVAAGLTAVVAAMDARLGARRLAVLWVALAVVTVVVLVQLIRLAFYPTIAEGQRCLAEAITEQGRAVCQEELGFLGG